VFNWCDGGAPTAAAGRKDHERGICNRNPRPGANEYNPYYGKYIEKVTGDDALAALESQIGQTLALLGNVDDTRALHRYADGKWSVKEVVGHITDGERVFAYRALRFGRADFTPLPGFDENIYVPAGKFDSRPMRELAAGFGKVRAATVDLFRSLDPEALTRTGEASGNPVSVRALAWIIAGHELHHVALLRERYGLGR
jgi:hypothetical protein